jgi:hypothetical protein
MVLNLWGERVKQFHLNQCYTVSKILKSNATSIGLISFISWVPTWSRVTTHSMPKFAAPPASPASPSAHPLSIGARVHRCYIGFPRTAWRPSLSFLTHQHDWGLLCCFHSSGGGRWTCCEQRAASPANPAVSPLAHPLLTCLPQPHRPPMDPCRRRCRMALFRRQCRCRRMACSAATRRVDLPWLELFPSRKPVSESMVMDLSFSVCEFLVRLLNPWHLFDGMAMTRSRCFWPVKLLKH